MPARKEAIFTFFEVDFAIRHIQVQFIIILDVKLLQPSHVEEVVKGDENVNAPQATSRTIVAKGHQRCLMGRGIGTPEDVRRGEGFHKGKVTVGKPRVVGRVLLLMLFPSGAVCCPSEYSICVSISSKSPVSSISMSQLSSSRSSVVSSAPSSDSPRSSAEAVLRSGTRRLPTSESSIMSAEVIAELGEHPPRLLSPSRTYREDGEGTLRVSILNLIKIPTTYRRRASHSSLELHLRSRDVVTMDHRPIGY